MQWNKTEIIHRRGNSITSKGTKGVDVRRSKYTRIKVVTMLETKEKKPYKYLPLDIHVSVHHDTIYENDQQDATV